MLLPFKKFTKPRQSTDEMWFIDGLKNAYIKKQKTLHQLCRRSNPKNLDIMKVNLLQYYGTLKDYTTEMNFAKQI